MIFYNSLILYQVMILTAVVCVLCLWTLKLSVLLELSMKMSTLFSCPCCISLVAMSILLKKDVIACKILEGIHVMAQLLLM
jgi:hypothetical protein